MPEAANRPTPPAGFRIRLDPRTQIWGSGRVLVGGSPWRISRLSASAQSFVHRLSARGSRGLELASAMDRQVARILLDRGFAMPSAPPRTTSSPARVDIETVIPVLDDPTRLDRLLDSLAANGVHVVDDGSRDPQAIAAVAAVHGAAVHRLQANVGPAAARNAGIARCSADLIACIDADCVADPDWAQRLSHHFDDPMVAAVTPRIVPLGGHHTLIGRYLSTRSSLDMGRDPEVARPGARLGFVPSAALVLRRSSIEGPPFHGIAFHASLRLGEDVDLTWRLAAAGWLVRYDPSVMVQHASRSTLRAWLTRTYEYGTSAPTLHHRHPGALAPARVSAWNLATMASLVAGQPWLAAGIMGTATALLWRRISNLPEAPTIAARTVSQGLLADAASVGHLLRREWWPIGALALVASPRSKWARAAAATMLTPIALEWIRQRPPIDPIRYVGLRLLDDAAYGTGVIAASARSRDLGPLTAHVRIPGIGQVQSWQRRVLRHGHRLIGKSPSPSRSRPLSPGNRSDHDAG